MIHLIFDSRFLRWWYQSDNRFKLLNKWQSRFRLGYKVNAIKWVAKRIIHNRVHRIFGFIFVILLVISNAIMWSLPTVTKNEPEKSTDASISSRAKFSDLVTDIPFIVGIFGYAKPVNFLSSY